MSDPKRATLITVGAPKSAKNNVNKTVRLTINLDESNESKYPELNYKELVIAEERKKRVENGKTSGLDPFSDNDDDVERVARKFEQKYGGKSTYGRRGRSKHDDFADIGAGYDENDSFIDNTDGYDEMIPPECDTLYGGFYINSGSLEFKNVPENQIPMSDDDIHGNRRNKRRVSSSSSEDDSSESSSESESQDEKEPKAIANGAVDSHKTEHRKKKNKKIDKKKAKKVRRTDSSAATSGKQTSDDNAHGDGESADSRTSQSDSLTSKPAPSSDNPITSDSSRDTEAKVEVKLPSTVAKVLEELEVTVSKLLADNPTLPTKELLDKTDEHMMKIDSALTKCSADARTVRSVWARAAKATRTNRAKLTNRAKTKANSGQTDEQNKPPTASQPPSSTNTTTSSTASTVSHKRKREEDPDDGVDFSTLGEYEREAKIVETLERLTTLIEEKKPDMIASYNAECERVQEERKKIQIASAEGGPVVEKRLPKRRFPWCPKSRGLLAKLRRLAGEQDAAGTLLSKRVLPLFPLGFVRMPTLLRQADLSKDVKSGDFKRQRINSSSQPPTNPVPTFNEQIQFPSSLTVTTMKTNNEVNNTENTKIKSNTIFGTIVNSYSLSKDVIIEKEKKEDKIKEDSYIPPNNIGSITITPVPTQKDKKTATEKGAIRVKSPAALNEMVTKKDKLKKIDKNHIKDKRIDTPLHVDTNFSTNKKNVSPLTKDEIPQKQIENMRVNENNIPRPALVPVHHSPTFAKPDKRAPEVKKKKDLVIVSDLDPLGDGCIEPLAIDDSSSDVEVIEEKTDKCEPKMSENNPVPFKGVADSKKVNSVKSKVKDVSKSNSEDVASEELNRVMRNIREMEGATNALLLS
ncbi:hypothetical protein K1T71_011945 [Dendrolimus kikuchii]|uniref:Uncharacterized protein n=1 Tax=Dendrolimus kikuchii TaxID=765133 RepID=A0ACC1CMY7_9NEOP|nr:hypothetical protein K1T71_011945 [Dendrolimus kikuchii]